METETNGNYNLVDRKALTHNMRFLYKAVLRELYAAVASNWFIFGVQRRLAERHSTSSKYNHSK